MTRSGFPNTFRLQLRRALVYLRSSGWKRTPPTRTTAGFRPIRASLRANKALSPVPVVSLRGFVIIADNPILRRGRMRHKRLWGAVAAAAIASLVAAETPKQFTPQQRRWWAFQKVIKPPAPQPKNTTWVKNSIDAFVLARLEE